MKSISGDTVKRAGQAARFPFSVHSPDEKCDFFYPLGPGVMGWAVDRGNDVIYIEQLRAVKEGNGDVGRFLDSLPANALIWNVTSARLEGMLRRRGWIKTVERKRVYLGWVIDIWCKPEFLGRSSSR